MREGEEDGLVSRYSFTLSLHTHETLKALDTHTLPYSLSLSAFLCAGGAASAEHNPHPLSTRDSRGVLHLFVDPLRRRRHVDLLRLGVDPQQLVALGEVLLLDVLVFGAEVLRGDGLGVEHLRVSSKESRREGKQVRERKEGRRCCAAMVSGPAPEGGKRVESEESRRGK